MWQEGCGYRKREFMCSRTHNYGWNVRLIRAPSLRTALPRELERLVVRAGLTMGKIMHACDQARPRKRIDATERPIACLHPERKTGRAARLSATFPYAAKDHCSVPRQGKAFAGTQQRHKTVPRRKLRANQAHAAMATPDLCKPCRARGLADVRVVPAVTTLHAVENKMMDNRIFTDGKL
eukprot:6183767-Pleurochrysis_carterae.AAC.4